MLIHRRLLVCREVLLDVVGPRLEGCHTRGRILPALLDDIEGLLEHLFIALLRGSWPSGCGCDPGGCDPCREDDAAGGLLSW